MKATLPSSRFAKLACVALLLAVRGADAQATPAPFAPAPSTRAQGSLRRVDPGQRSDDPNDLKGLLAREFERDRWRERLLQPDLELREKSFDALLKRTRFDPVARGFLEELAADPKGGELAWTARLALRELGRASVPLQGFAPGLDPFGSAQRMQQWMDELFGRDGLAMRLPHAVLPQAPLGLTFGSGRSLQVEQTEGGAKVRITETIDGQEQTREYQGKSLQEILDAHPELQGELDGLSIHVQPGSPLDLRFDLGERLPRVRRFPGERQEGLRLEPQGKSRPIFTDRLGVIVGPVSAERARELGLQGRGLLVERAVPETYAYLLGVGAGDVLIELNEVALVTAADIERAMGARRPDDELTLVWMDELGQRQEKTWKPGEH